MTRDIPSLLLLTLHLLGWGVSALLIEVGVATEGIRRRFPFVDVNEPMRYILQWKAIIKAVTICCAGVLPRAGAY